jgi:glycosidase
MLAHDRLYPDPSVLVTFSGLHDVSRFMNEPGATVAGRKLADTFLLSARGTPLLYYGDEIGLRGGGDPDNRRDFPGGFPGDTRDAFTTGGRTAEEAAIFDNLRRLAWLRAQLEPLRRGRLVTLAVGEQTWAYARVLDGQAVVVAINNGTAPAELDVPTMAAGWTADLSVENRLGGGTARVERGVLRVSLGARSAAIYTVR